MSFVLLFSFILPSASAQEIIGSWGGNNDDTVYVTGFISDNVFKITHDGVKTEIIDSTGDGNGKVLDGPRGISVDYNGNVYVAGYHSNNVFKITPDGVKTEIIDWEGDGNGNTLSSPRGVAVDYNGNVYVAGYYFDNVFKITPDGEISEIIDSTGDGNGNDLDGPIDVAVDSNDNVYVAGYNSDNVFKITPDGVITEIIDHDTTYVSGLRGVLKKLMSPRALTVDYNDNVYVAGVHSHNVWRIAPDGVITHVINNHADGIFHDMLSRPRAIAVDSNGNVYAAGYYSDNVFKKTPDGVITEIIDGVDDGTGKQNSLYFDRPTDITVDYNGNVYVTGHRTDNVFKITPDGEISKIIERAGDGNGNRLDGPFGIAVKLSQPIRESIVVSDNSHKKSGGGCSGDCTPPTIGLGNNGMLLVKDGITINGHSEDGGYYHTEYPMQYTELHQQNRIDLKYYDNSGPHAISIVQLGIGVKDIGTPISESQALIEVHMDYFSDDIYNPILKKVVTIDPDEILYDVSADVKLSTCNESYDVDKVNVKLSDSYGFNDRYEFYKNLVDSTCLSVGFNYSYDKIPDSWILLSNAIDYKRNTFNNYFNDGLTVIDTNPVIEIQEEQYKYECTDGISHVMTRNNCNFNYMKQYEIQKSIYTVKQICPTCILSSFDGFENSWEYEYPERLDSLDDPKIIKLMKYEETRALEYHNQEKPFPHLR